MNYCKKGIFFEDKIKHENINEDDMCYCLSMIIEEIISSFEKEMKKKEKKKKEDLFLLKSFRYSDHFVLSSVEKIPKKIDNDAFESLKNTIKNVHLKQSSRFEKNPLDFSKNILVPLIQLKESIKDEDIEKIKISNIFSGNIQKTLTIVVKVTLIQYIWQSALLLETLVVPLNKIIFTILGDAVLTTSITTAIGTLFGSAPGTLTGFATGVIASFLKKLPMVLTKEIPLLINNTYKALESIFKDNKLKGTPLIFPAIGIFLPLFSGPTATVFLTAFLIPFFFTQLKKFLELKSKQKKEDVLIKKTSNELNVTEFFLC